jgi:uncharacterized protein
VIVNFDHRGSFSTFDPELLAVAAQSYGDFLLGNARTNSLQYVCGPSTFWRNHHAMSAGIEECRRSCDGFGICGGSAGSNKNWEHDTIASAETQACR